jgi:hypothetical protein
MCIAKRSILLTVLAIAVITFLAASQSPATASIFSNHKYAVAIRDVRPTGSWNGEKATMQVRAGGTQPAGC